MSRGKVGAATGGMEKSPARKKREADRRRAQEARWAAKSGPVVVKRANDGGDGGDPAERGAGDGSGDR